VPQRERRRRARKRRAEESRLRWTLRIAEKITTSTVNHKRWQPDGIQYHINEHQSYPTKLALLKYIVI
jgi:hypothetical protein